MVLSDRQGRYQAFVGVGGGHLDVDQGDVGSVRGDQTEQRLSVARLPDNVDVLGGQQLGDACPEQHHVLGDHDPHGAVPSMMRPSAVETILNSPPAATKRSSA